MFWNVLSYFQDNRKKIIIILACLGVILLFLKALEHYQKQNSSSSNDTTTAIINNTANELKYVNSSENDNVNSNNIEIEERSINSPENVIEAFTIYCNNNQIEDAYNLLTEDCKKYVYKTQDEFYNNYYKVKLQGKKQISYSKYGDKDDNVYKIFIRNDSIVTGKSDNSFLEDYFSVEEYNNTYKLNIGGFIKAEKIDKSNENEFLKIDIKNRLVFMDYELYEIEIQNKIYANINLYNALKTNNIYIEDGNEQKYYFDNDNYVEQDLLVNFKSNKTINLKFTKSYDYSATSSNEEIKNMIFSDIRIINRLNYDNSVQIETSDGVQYEEKYTTYPNSTNLNVKM